MNDRTLNEFDSEGLRFVATIMVWVRWFVASFYLVQMIYRPADWPASFAVYLPAFLLLVGVNGYTHYRLLTNRVVSRGWILALAAIDVLMVSAATAAGGGFSHYFLYLLYYPPLVGYAVVFTSFRLTMVCVTLVGALYLAICLTVGEGIDPDMMDEKALFARIFVMYAVAASVSLIVRFERTRWMQAAERERALQRDRVVFSQTVHDTTSQSAFMVGLGIDAAMAQAEEGSPELAATLEATSKLSRSTIWELRHPINVGSIYEGRDLGWALRAHTRSFTNITSVPAEMTQTGEEPRLSIEDRGILFSIAHNALTNAYRHAEASRVYVHLEFGEEEIRLSVSDDGIGLPDDYVERGRGFDNMGRNAERLAGSLVVEERGPMGGATVTCVIPAE